MAINPPNIYSWIFSEQRINFATINQLTVKDLENPQTYQRFLYTLADPEYQTNPSSIIAGINSLLILLKKYPQFSQDFPEINKKYLEIIIYLKFQSLAVQPSSIILDLFKNYLIFAIESQVEIKVKLESLFSWYHYAIIDWENLRILILKAFKENEEQIGGGKIKLQQEEREPTIKNWLNDYIIFSASNKDSKTLDRTVYLSQSANTQKMKPKEKEILIKALELYDYLDFDLRWDRAAGKNGLIFYQKPAVVLKQNNLPITKKENNEKLATVLQQRQTKPADPFEQKYLEESSDVNDEE